MLMSIPLESTGRCAAMSRSAWRSCRISEPLLATSRIIPDEEKLRVYIQIVRLLLESGESGQAQTYFTRASLIIHGTESKEIQLSYRLCQVRPLAGPSVVKADLKSIRRDSLISVADSMRPQAGITS